DRAAQVRQALRLLEAAAALGEKHGLAATQTLHVRRARYLAWLGDQQGAQQERDRAARLQPRAALDHFLAAQDSYKQGKYPAAVAACAQVLTLQPDHYWAPYLLGLCYLKTGRWVEARSE